MSHCLKPDCYFAIYCFNYVIMPRFNALSCFKRPVNPWCTARVVSRPQTPSCLSAAAKLRDFTPLLLPAPIVLTGPTGGGKSEIASKLLNHYGDCFDKVITHTTRPATSLEIHDKDHYFIEAMLMRIMINREKFFESTEHDGYLYGVSKDALAKSSATGKIPVMEVNLRGAKALRRSSEMPDNPKLIFCSLTMPTLEKQVKSKVKERNKANVILDQINSEVDEGMLTSDNFDVFIMRNDLDKCYKSLIEFLQHDIDHIRKKHSQRADPAITSETSPNRSRDLVVEVSRSKLNRSEARPFRISRVKVPKEVRPFPYEAGLPAPTTVRSPGELFSWVTNKIRTHKVFRAPPH